MKSMALAFTLALVGTTGVANAATCADRGHVVSQLEQRFGETLYANAISSSNNVMEVFASPNGDTWSITLFLPERNLSCLAATGKGMERLTAALQLR